MEVIKLVAKPNFGILKAAEAHHIYYLAKTFLNKEELNCENIESKMIRSMNRRINFSDDAIKLESS